MPDLSKSATSGWEQWYDADGTMHVEITLTAGDQKKFGPRFCLMLNDAGKLIQAALKEPD